MALWQEAMIRLARSPKVVDFAQGQRALTGLATRFVSGSSVAAAIETAARLAGEGIASSLYYLGEYVTDPAVFDETVGQLTQALQAAAERGLDVAASVDPTQIGLMVDVQTCQANAERLARAVAEAAPQPRRGHDALMLDMEDATVTQATLDLHRTLSEQGLPVAVTLQGYLHRSTADLDDLVARGSWVRLVKGAFAEPAHLAARRPAEIDSRFRQAVSQLLSPAALEAGVFPTFATHDHRIIAEIIAHARANRWASDSFEFEMLYGVRTELQRQLVAQGHRVRVYLPFGRDWFPYSIRRVGESPRNLRFVAATLLRRS